MSDPVRIGLVAEGPTDHVVLEAALSAMFPGRSIVLTLLQPEASLVFGEMGTGWGGVMRWCMQSVAKNGGSRPADALLVHAFVIVHVDADIAGKKYADVSVTPAAHHLPLPCEKPCPPPSATADELRKVVGSWLTLAGPIPELVLCVPSKSTEAWVMQALFPNDSAVQKGIECHDDPEARLGVQPKKERMRKKRADYRARASDITKAWPNVTLALTEAKRLDDDVRATFAALGL